MLHPELFKQFESVRRDLDKDIPWSSFDAGKLTHEQASLAGGAVAQAA